jgi:hypothetical protein
MVAKKERRKVKEERIVGGFSSEMKRSIACMCNTDDTE